MRRALRAAAGVLCASVLSTGCQSLQSKLPKPSWMKKGSDEAAVAKAEGDDASPAPKKRESWIFRAGHWEQQATPT
ncbi:MAG: hypothetical protein L0099_11120, partial [Acidobacteria bacterium]|nr:hypothetical protein [Acidobacteriota bacterium]